MVRPISIFVIVFFTNFIFFSQVNAEDKQCDSMFNPLVLSEIDICPKPSLSSNFKDPKIQVTTSWSTLFFSDYLTTHNHLSNGQCIYYPGIPSIRYCARIAQVTPDPDPNKPYKMDPGYTKYYHINDNSISEKDDPAKYEQIIESDYNNTAYEKCLKLQSNDPIFGTQPASICSQCPDQPKKSCKISFDYYSMDPKLCLYYDPWLADIAFLIYDPLDYNPLYQPFHTGTTSMLGTILITFLKLGVGGIEGLVGFMVGFIPGINSLINFLGELIKVMGEALIKGLTQLNTFAFPIGPDGGCVPVPLGPNPPPYCATLSCGSINMVVKIDKICPTIIAKTLKNGNGVITEQDLITKTSYNTITETIKDLDTTPSIKSISANSPQVVIDDCVPPSMSSNNTIYDAENRNNFIHNSVRISYSWPLNLCNYDSSEAPPQASKALKIEQEKDNQNYNAGMCARIFPDRNSLSEDVKRRGLIPACTSSGLQCVNIHDSATLTKKPYYRINLKLDTDHSGNVFSIITGVNIGDFQDVTINYDNGIYDLQQIASLSDINANKTSYIVKVSGDDSDKTSQPINSICVYNSSSSNKIIDCVKRAEPPIPQIYDCNTKIGGKNCSSEFQNPSGIVGVEVGIDRFYETINKNSIQNKIGISGLSIKSFITDESFLYPPFDINKPRVFKDNPKSDTQSTTIFGKYDPDISASSISDTQLSNMPKIDGSHTYIYGLEYYKGEYRYGGKYLCLDSSKYVNCPNNPKDCVLVKTTNNLCQKVQVDPTGRSNNNSQDLSKLCIPSSSLDDRLWPPAPSISDKTSLDNLILHDQESDKEKNQCYTPQSYVKMIDNMKSKMSSIPSYIDASPCKIPSLDDINNIKAKVGGGTSDSDIDENISTKVAIRNKNSIEKGMCIMIPTPLPCSSINIASEDSGFAAWPETSFGEQAVGLCDSSKGYTGSPKRYCIVDLDTGLTSFGRIDSPCSNKPKVLPVCQEIREHNGIYWPTTKAGETARGRCPNFRRGNLSRTCIYNKDTNSSSFGPIYGVCNRIVN